MHDSRIIQFLLDLLFEEKCLICKKSGTPLCLACASSAEPAVEPEHPHVWSAFNYHDPAIKRAVYRLKYSNKKVIADALGDALYDRMFETLADKRLEWGLADDEIIHILPVPLSSLRMRERGYNQAELIARRITVNNPMSFIVLDNVLYKTRETESQVRVKDRRTRLTNLRSAFSIQNMDLIFGKCLILLDDVTTTGTTLEECRNLLLSAGAREVFCITLAH